MGWGRLQRPHPPPAKPMVPSAFPKQFTCLIRQNSPSSLPAYLQSNEANVCVAWTGTKVYKSLTVEYRSGRAFFCQSPVASTWPWAGLSRDHFIPHLLILESATLLNKVLLTSNGWKNFQLLFRYQKYHLMARATLALRLGRLSSSCSTTLDISKSSWVIICDYL